MNRINWQSYFQERVIKYGPGYKSCATYGSLFKLRCKVLEKHYRDVKGKMILDCGSGNGFSMEFLTADNKVFGIDNVFEMLPMSVKKGLKAVAGNLDHNLPFCSNTFDSVSIISVLQYIINPENLIQEIYRVLKPGGDLVLYSQNKSSWIRAALTFMNNSRSEEFRKVYQQLKNLIENNGFDYIKTYLIRYPLPFIGEVIYPSYFQLGFSTSFIIVAEKTG